MPDPADPSSRDPRDALRRLARDEVAVLEELGAVIAAIRSSAASLPTVDDQAVWTKVLEGIEAGQS